MKGLWIGLAVAGSLLFLAGVLRLAWMWRPGRREQSLPPTMPERLAWMGLVITGIIGSGLGLIVAIGGAAAFHEDRSYRIAFWALILLGGIVWYGGSVLIKRRHGPAVIDERDRAVLARSLSVESVVVLVSLVAWTVSLTETFWDEAAVPLEYLQLLFWTTLIGGLFGRCLGVLLGYRQETVPHA